MRGVIVMVGVVTGLAGLTACKPPPTDAGLDRELPEAEPVFASDPLPSPDTEGAMWAVSPQRMLRIIYGIPGEPALMALECNPTQGLNAPELGITRLSPADENATALLALVGNGHIGRIEVSAVNLGGRSFWSGAASAHDERWQPLAGPRQSTVTVPGAGMVRLNPSTLPSRLIDLCRNGETWTPEVVARSLKVDGLEAPN
ncbi:MAG: hypothetical protein AAF707_08750 [Pseudomonadota bacterium]